MEHVIYELKQQLKVLIAVSRDKMNDQSLSKEEFLVIKGKYEAYQNTFRLLEKFSKHINTTALS